MQRGTMLLYHGSLAVVEHPVMLRTYRAMDFGPGFYTTTSAGQARRFVERRLKVSEAQSGYVNVYELAEEALEPLRVLRFPEAGREWLSFVRANRLERNYAHDYDLVVGPVADDSVVRSLLRYLAGECDEERVLSELKSGRLIDQWLFHTQTALDLLSFVRKVRVSRNGSSDGGRGRGV